MAAYRHEGISGTSGAGRQGDGTMLKLSADYY